MSRPSPSPSSSGGAFAASPPSSSELTEVFARERPRLVGLAYRITGSRLDAEDIVQDAWLRAQRTDWRAVERPEAWLTTVVSRLALDELRSARRRRETYVGPWLPEPVRASDGAVLSGAGPFAGTGQRSTGTGQVGEPSSGDVGHREATDPAMAVELAETLTFGFLRVLETLGPVERVVFLLADVFDTPYQEIADAVGRPPSHCRQIASRARQRVRAGRPRRDPPEDRARTAYDLFVAVTAGDVDRVISMLADDVVLLNDGGAGTYAARRPVRGPWRVARFVLNLARREYRDVETELTLVNGEPGIVVREDGRRRLALSVQVTDGAVAAIHAVNNPDKLAALDLTTAIT
jgi:RNA polymerase sigma-70 factor (ECF subfamily)